MADKKPRDVFTREKITVIKRYIGRCFRDYKIHYNTEDTERFAWIFSLRGKKKAGRKFSVIIQDTLFEDLNDLELAILLAKHNLTDYLDDGVKRIIIDYRRTKEGGGIIFRKEKE